MAEPDLSADYDAFWDELLRDAEVSGDPQHASFFRMYAELAAENGDCADLVYCPVIREGARPYQVDGYAFDRDRGELHVAVCDFRPEREMQSLNADGINALFRRVHRFCSQAVRPEFLKELEETSPEFELAAFIQANADFIKRIRCVMFSNARLATRKKTLEAGNVIGAEMTFNIIDFIRFVDIQNAMGGVEPIELDLLELNEGILPCLQAHFEDSDYESYLVVMPGSLLARIYGLYGARLMEQNVRTFLQAQTKANKGIIRTANEEPEMFFAYNNGITATAIGMAVYGLRPVVEIQFADYMYPGYDQLVSALAASELLPQRVAHFWPVSAASEVRPGSSLMHRNQECGFYSLLFLAQALGDAAPDKLPRHIAAISNGMQAVLPDEVAAFPEKATLLGPIRVIPHEFAGVRCQSIDLALPAASDARLALAPAGGTGAMRGVPPAV